MVTVNQLRKIHDEVKHTEEEYSDSLLNSSEDIKNIAEDNKKLVEQIKNVNIVIDNLDKNFEEKTSIKNPLDRKFLWGAVALQCARWLLIPSLDEKTLETHPEDRKNPTLEGKKDKSKSGDYLDKHGQNIFDGYIDEEQIMNLPVPYDATYGTEDIVIPGVTEYGKNICGTNHHAATWGHDPILGYVFGTMNILTRSITFHDFKFTTRRVFIPSGRTQIVEKGIYNIPLMCKDVYGTMKEDPIKRLPFALMKEHLHLLSDKNTYSGLPIPMLPASLQQKLLEKKWNSKELENILKGSFSGVTKQLFIAILINSVIGTLHGFCYNEIRDQDLKLYGVRTRKIIATSNTISSGINVAAVLTGTVGGILSGNTNLAKKSLSHTDIGGYIECIHQIIQSKKLQENIRREYLERELYNELLGDKFSFLEEDGYE